MANPRNSSNGEQLLPEIIRTNDQLQGEIMEKLTGVSYNMY